MYLFLDSWTSICWRARFGFDLHSGTDNNATLSQRNRLRRRRESIAFGSFVSSVWVRKPQQRFYSWSDMFSCKMRLPSHHPHYVSSHPLHTRTHTSPARFLHIVLFWDQESQSQFHCQKASILEMSTVNPSNMLCHWPQYKGREKIKDRALLLVSYYLCVLISDTANIRQSTHALSQLENLYYKLREKRINGWWEERRQRGGEMDRGRKRKGYRENGNKEPRQSDRNENVGKGKGWETITLSKQSYPSHFLYTLILLLHYPGRLCRVIVVSDSLALSCSICSIFFFSVLRQPPLNCF